MKMTKRTRRIRKAEKLVGRDKRVPAVELGAPPAEWWYPAVLSAYKKGRGRVPPEWRHLSDLQLAESRVAAIWWHKMLPATRKRIMTLAIAQKRSAVFREKLRKIKAKLKQIRSEEKKKRLAVAANPKPPTASAWRKLVRKHGVKKAAKLSGITLSRSKNPSVLQIIGNPKDERLETVCNRCPRVANPTTAIEFQKALATYKRFHGTTPLRIIKVKVPEGTPKFLVALGKAPDVTYEVPKHSRKPGGVPYLHKFGRGGKGKPFLVTDATGKMLQYVGGRFRVTDWIRG